MQKNNTSTSLITKESAPQKIYYVLKKSNQRKRNSESNYRRLEAWLEEKKDYLQDQLKDFDDPKKAFECVMLKKLLAILAQMQEEYKGKLNERDLQNYRKLIEESKSDFENDDEDKKEKQKDDDWKKGNYSGDAKHSEMRNLY